MDTLKTEKLREYAEELEIIAESLKNECKVQRALADYTESLAKWQVAKMNVFECPNEYYHLQLFDKEVYIGKAKYKYYENLGTYGKAKIWTYTIKCNGYTPKCFDTKTHRIYFNAELQSYGAFKSLNTAIFYFKCVCLEMIKALQYDKLVQELFKDEEMKRKGVEYNPYSVIYNNESGVEIKDIEPISYTYNK